MRFSNPRRRLSIVDILINKLLLELGNKYLDAREQAESRGCVCCLVFTGGANSARFIFSQNAN